MLKLTEASKKELRGYHAGSGQYFVSDGTGQGTRTAFIGLRTTNGKYYLTLGHNYIELTPDQIGIIGTFFIEEVIAHA